MVLIWASVLLAFSVGFEALAGNRGIVLPLTCLTAFYLLVSQKQMLVFPLACAAAMLVDIHFARPALPSLLLLPLLACLARYWRENGNSSQVMFLMIPGVIIGGAHLGIVGIFPYLAGLHPSATGPLVPVGGLVLSTVFLPCLALLYDTVADKAALTRITDVKPERSAFQTTHF